MKSALANLMHFWKAASVGMDYFPFMKNTLIRMDMDHVMFNIRMTELWARNNSCVFKFAASDQDEQVDGMKKDKFSIARGPMYEESLLCLDVRNVMDGSGFARIMMPLVRMHS